MEDSIYSFKANTLQGKEIEMGDYKGNEILVVNTASKCGFTPQYAGLEELHEKYKDKGLTILGFPCNQFGSQEPGGKNEIEECLVNYGVGFQMFEKINVNGKDAHPMFKYLKKQLPGTLGGRIKWNFTKFLISGDGKPLKRFSSQTKPEKIEPMIKSLLN